jgi:hypothetical protein
MNYTYEEKNKIANTIRKNYNDRLSMKITDDLEAALFFSTVPKNYKYKENNVIMPEFIIKEKKIKQYSNTFFSSVGSSETLKSNNENLQAINFMVAGYLLHDILDYIIFPKKPEYINSNYYLDSDNYDRLFNCMYLSSACEYNQQNFALNFLSYHSSKFFKTSSNDVMYQLLCLQVGYSKEDTNSDEDNYVNCGVSILCRDWWQKVGEIVRYDGTSENMFLDYMNYRNLD